MSRATMYYQPTEGEIRDGFERGLGDKAMADKLGTSPNVVRSHRQRLGLRRDAPPPPITPRQQALLIGSMLGDASLSSSTGGRTASLSESHAVDQREYLAWKHSLWGHRALPLREYPARKPSHQDSVGFSVKAGGDFGYWYRLFYHHKLEGVAAGVRRTKKTWSKRFPEEVVPLVTPFALAVWYMDDGAAQHWPILCCREANHRVGLLILEEYGFTPETCSPENRTDYDPFQGLILQGEEQALRFLDLIRPHRHPSLEYKWTSPTFLTGHSRMMKIDAAGLRDKVEVGASVREMSHEFGVSPRLVKRRLRQLGLRAKVCRSDSPHLRERDDDDLSVFVIKEPSSGRPKLRLPQGLLTDLVNAGTSVAAMSRRFDVSDGVVKRELTRFELCARDGRGAGKKGYKYGHMTKEAMAKAFESGMSIKAMAAVFDCHPHTVRKRLDEYAIKPVVPRSATATSR
jgi:transposase-like protein/DNA-binding CsgD family transcriptional regulator